MMKNNCLPILLTSIPLVGYTANSSAVQEVDQPNIVIIIADDLGTNELSFYGVQNLITPNMNRLAGEGIRLINNYTSCTMSIPIRVSMYTELIARYL